MSDFERNFLQRVSFWVYKITSRLTLNYKFYDASIFELKTLQHVDFWLKRFTTIRKRRKFCFQKITSQLLLLCRIDSFCIFVLFQIAWSWVLNIINCRLWMKHFPTRQVLNIKNYIATDFELKILQLVRLWVKNSYNVSDFELKNIRPVRF